MDKEKVEDRKKDQPLDTECNTLGHTTTVLYPKWLR